MKQRSQNNPASLPLKTKLGFGIGDLGGNLFFTIIGFYLLYFLTDVAVLAPALAGTALMVGKIWAALAYCLLNTAYTLVNIPYSALLPELSRDYHQRTVLAGFRMSFAVIGTFVGAAGVLPILGLIPNERWGWTIMGFVMGAVMVITALITFGTVREPYGTPIMPEWPC